MPARLEGRIGQARKAQIGLAVRPSGEDARIGVHLQGQQRARPFRTGLALGQRRPGARYGVLQSHALEIGRAKKTLRGFAQGLPVAEIKNLLIQQKKHAHAPNRLSLRLG